LGSLHAATVIAMEHLPPSQPTIDEAAAAAGAPTSTWGSGLSLPDSSARVEVERQRAQQLEAVAVLGELAVNAQDPLPVLTTATCLVASTLSVDVVHVLEAVPGGEHLVVRAANVHDDGLEGTLIAVAGSLAGFTLRNQVSVQIPDLAADHRFAVPSLRAMGVMASASVLVRGRDHPFGVLGVHARHPRAFTRDEMHFLETVANIVSGVLARHAAESALLDRERQLRAVFDHALDPIFTFDNTGRVVEVNPAACRLCGRDRARILGRRLAALVGSRGRARVEAVGRELLESGRVSGEFEMSPPGMSPRRVEFSAVADILPGLHLGVMRDVTEQRALQGRLAFADRMVSVGTLAAGIAHELNNPLACVISNLCWLYDGLSSAPVQPSEAGACRSEIIEAIDDARDGAERMRDIIRELRTFYRGDDTQVGPVELEKVLESCIGIAQNQIRRRARLVRDFAPVPAVHGNEATLAQVFLSLVVNAVQAIPEGDAERYRIRLAIRACADGRVAAEVEDNGCGIAPEHRHRIFDPFFTTKPPGVGTGLGLSVCHNLVDALGGAIEVESEVGRGSLFRVVLRPWTEPTGKTAPGGPLP
jgi:PAS domain S-box-containing protein